MSQNIVYCDNCDGAINVAKETKTRQMEFDVEETGFRCPTCLKWYHSFYLNSELKKLLNNKKRDYKQYKKKFQEFQKERKDK